MNSSIKKPFVLQNNISIGISRVENNKDQSFTNLEWILSNLDDNTKVDKL